MKKIFITGGSGTVGTSFIEKYYKEYDFFSYSRNEKMQVSLKRKFDKVEIILGSIEDKLKLSNSIARVNPDVIIHAAALKHVDSAEISPIQAVKSNIIGSLNVIEAAIMNNISSTVAISTDKACSPDNNYGYTKSLMEKMFLEAYTPKNKFTVCRFGNVSHSHGSVIPYWLRLRAEGKPLLLTHELMNRLMFSRDEAVELVHRAILKTNKEEDTFILSQKMKSINVKELAHTISDNVRVVGMRPGEKLNEILISSGEVPYTFVDGKFITIRKYKNKNKNTLDGEYSSENAEFMTKKEIISAVSETDQSLEKSLLESRIY